MTMKENYSHFPRLLNLVQSKTTKLHFVRASQVRQSSLFSTFAICYRCNSKVCEQIRKFHFIKSPIFRYMAFSLLMLQKWRRCIPSDLFHFHDILRHSRLSTRGVNWTVFRSRRHDYYSPNLSNAQRYVFLNVNSHLKMSKVLILAQIEGSNFPF